MGIAIFALMQVVVRPIVDSIWNDPVPHGVAIGTAPTGPYPTVDPARVIPGQCPGVRRVKRLVTNGWDLDKDGRSYQDYAVDFDSGAADIARLYLDDGAVRCP